MFFVGGGWLVGKIVASVLIPKDEVCNSKSQNKIIVNNHITENHLHITKEDLKALKK